MSCVGAYACVAHAHGAAAQNGGMVLWTRRGLGKFGGWMAAFNKLGSNLCDLCVYATLFETYVEACLTDTFGLAPFSFFGQWAVKLGVLCVVAYLNVRGVHEVAIVSMILTAFIVIPFLLQPILIAGSISLAGVTSVATDVDWAVFSAQVLWNFQVCWCACVRRRCACNPTPNPSCVRPPSRASTK